MTEWLHSAQWDRSTARILVLMNKRPGRLRRMVLADADLASAQSEAQHPAVTWIGPTEDLTLRHFGMLRNACTRVATRVSARHESTCLLAFSNRRRPSTHLP